MFNRRRKLMMTGLASLVIVAALGFFSFQYVSGTSETSPVAATSRIASHDNITIYSGLTQNLDEDDLAEVIIAAPAEIKLGKLVVLDVSQSVGNKFEWMVVPETEDFLVIDEGRRAVFSSGVPGEFMFIVACAVNDSVDVKRHIVRVIGVTPPPPQPPVPPTPPGPETALSKQVGTWCAKIQSPSRSGDAVKLAGAFEGVAAQIDAGTLTQPYDIITATTEANRASLGDQLQAWIPFLRSLQAELEQRADDGLLVTPVQHSAVWKEIAKGLRVFAASKLQ